MATMLADPHARAVARLVLLGGMIAAQTVSAEEAVRLPYECTDADMDAFGLACSTEDPCPVFLELASAEAAGGRLLVAGNLHTKNVTMYGIVLSSEDNGATWAEASPRIRAAALEQIEFFDLQDGWINGESIDPLARNPFFLLTNDGGKTWRQKFVADDAKYGTVAQYHFDSPAHGELVLDASQGKQVRQELYESNTGGESWELKQVNNAPIRLKGARGQVAMRVRADAATGAFVVERGGGKTWDRVASFLVHVTDCQEKPPAVDGDTPIGGDTQ